MPERRWGWSGLRALPERRRCAPRSGLLVFQHEFCELVSIDLASQSVPDLIGTTGDKVESFRGGACVIWRCATCAAAAGFRQTVFRQVEFEQAVHAAKAVNRIQPVAHDADPLRKVHRPGIVEHAVAHDAVFIEPVAADAQVAAPQMPGV